ncbi:hypothetical protein TWF730_010514 [Orbilia blumenaviensis]|uniref:Uncharacterized protein n=1 Tax=Orbilia blumenaviensis TaxID=1796055 RepID=A0AAV9UQ06_9PEZI
MKYIESPTVRMTFDCVSPLISAFSHLCVLKLIDDAGLVNSDVAFSIVAYSLNMNPNLRELVVSQRVMAIPWLCFGDEYITTAQNTERLKPVAKLKKLRVYFRRKSGGWADEGAILTQWIKSWIDVLQGATDYLQEFSFGEAQMQPFRPDSHMEVVTLLAGSRSSGESLWYLPRLESFEVLIRGIGEAPIRSIFVDEQNLSNVQSFKTTMSPHISLDSIRKTAVNISYLESLEALEMEICCGIRADKVSLLDQTTEIIPNLAILDLDTNFEEIEEGFFKEATEIIASRLTQLKVVVWKSIASRDTWDFESYVVRRRENKVDVVRCETDVELDNVEIQLLAGLRR